MLNFSGAYKIVQIRARITSHFLHSVNVFVVVVVVFSRFVFFGINVGTNRM